ncbi:MAG: hypothetical protein E6R04_09380 [Spirochaetes bacterium]|nr:MAG: hypothetical protein E6R04_09380 [Spirochaetota bacterium]
MNQPIPRPNFLVPAEVNRFAPTFIKREDRIQAYMNSGLSAQSLVARIARLRHGTGSISVAVFDRVSRETIKPSTTYQDLVERLVDIEIEERSVITEWATCASCGENRHSKARKSCKRCETIEDIRRVVPKDFETKRHQLSPENHTSMRLPFCLRTVNYSPEPWHVFLSQFSIEDWRSYYFGFVGNESDPEIAARPFCEECGRVQHEQHMAERHQEALYLDTQFNLRRQRREEKEKRVKAHQIQCKGCNRVFLKVPEMKANVQRNCTAFDALKLCGSCVSALVAGPRFDEFLKVMLDDAYERAAILWVIPEKEAPTAPQGQKDVK